MTLEEAMQLIETLKSEKETLTTQLNDVTKEKETIANLSETLKGEKEKLTEQVTSLKESNMRYFERLTFQNETLKETEIETKTQQNKEETISLDDVVNSLL